MDKIEELKKLLWILDSKHNVSIPQTKENIDYIADEIVKLFFQSAVSGSLPSREDAYKEGLNRQRRHEKNIVWKAKIFAAGAMWAKMKLTGISDVIGNDR